MLTRTTAHRKLRNRSLRSKNAFAQDVQNVIFNSNEFAEERYIDDKLMLCITQHPGVLERPAHWEGGAKQSFDQGMYKADLLLL